MKRWCVGLSLIVGVLCLASLVYADVAFDHTHELWNQVLQTYSKGGLVNYKALKENRGDLDTYVANLGAVTSAEFKRWTREEQLTYWINAYNAFTIQAILNHYPISRGFFNVAGLAFPSNSIRQIAGVWDSITFRAAGREVTLNDIEHEILRKQFHEPRIHFAIVCASIGCPLLQETAYRADQIDVQLEASARRFFANSEKARADVEEATLYLNPILDWFKEDFGDRIAFVQRYLPTVQADWKLEWLPYDWTLNELKS